MIKKCNKNYKFQNSKQNNRVSSVMTFTSIDLVHISYSVYNYIYPLTGLFT